VFIKRLFDITLSSTAILMLLPLLLILMLLVRMKLGSPVFFRQERPGLNEHRFYMLKFRTMTDERDADGKLLPDSIRLTPFGSFLRKTSLDELPELFNIFKGDMSFVGPRPLLIEYLDYYTEEEKLRHTVRPGLTGLAQVSGRNHVRWNERLALDIKYIKEWSFWLDIKILFRTALQVVRSKNVVVIPSSEFGKLSDERDKRK
jgi:lipopolysaccharide/colanic/teichoic acid biosynthesis glycosyltransferase